MAHAYACRATKENLDVIISEAGHHFDREFAEAWLEEFGEGYFLRDEGSALDCHFFVPEVFADVYRFVSNDTASLFRQVIRK